MTTPIGSKEKTDLANLVAENNSYDKWYKVNKASDDKKALAKAQKDIAVMDKLSDETIVERKKYDATRAIISKKHDTERRAMEKKFEAENSVVSDEYRKISNALEKQVSKFKGSLAEAGMTNSYEYNSDNERQYVWRMEKSRFTPEYQTWLRELRINILTSVTVEEAREHANKFLMK